MERIPHKAKDSKKSGHEIKGYDGLVFSIEDDKKIFWAGQVKTGTWKYCLEGIKEDINKSIIKYYFADSIAIMCDIMRAVSNSSSELEKIIDDINEIIYECNNDREQKTQRIIDYFNSERITIRIPCLVIPNESHYTNEKEIVQTIKKQIHDSFKGFGSHRAVGDSCIAPWHGFDKKTGTGIGIRVRSKDLSHYLAKHSAKK